MASTRTATDGKPGGGRVDDEDVEMVEGALVQIAELRALCEPRMSEARAIALGARIAATLLRRRK